MHILQLVHRWSPPLRQPQDGEGYADHLRWNLSPPWSSRENSTKSSNGKGGGAHRPSCYISSSRFLGSDEGRPILLHGHKQRSVIPGEPRSGIEESRQVGSMVGTLVWVVIAKEKTREKVNLWRKGENCTSHWYWNEVNPCLVAAAAIIIPVQIYLASPYICWPWRLNELL